MPKKNFTQSSVQSRVPPSPPSVNGNGNRLGPLKAPAIEIESEDRLFRQLRRRIFPAEVSGILHQTQVGDLYWQDQLWSIMVDTWPRLQTNLKKLRNAVSSMEYGVTAYALRGEEPTDTAIEKANFVEEALFGMTSNRAWGQKDFSETLAAVTDSIISGFTVLEVDWETRAGFGIAPKCTRWIPARYYRYPYQLDAVDRLMLNPSGMLGSTALIDFPAYKFLVSVYESHANFPAFAAPMRTLTSWWIASQFGLEWFMTFAQLYGIPQRLAFYEPGDDTVYAQLVQMMKASAAATWGVYPKGTEVRNDSTASSGGAMPQERLLQEADRICDILILGQTLTTDVHDSGSRALGTVHKSVLDEVFESAALYAAKLISTQIIPGIIQFNFGNTDELPVLEPVINTPIDLVQMATAFNILFNQMKIPVSKQELYDRIEFTPPEEDEDLYEPAGASTPPPSEGGSGSGGGAPVSEGPDGKAGLREEDQESGTEPIAEAANVHRHRSGRFATPETAHYRLLAGKKVHRKLPTITHRFPGETRVANKVESYFETNANQISGVSWQSVIDDRTTEQCRHLDGKNWTYPGLEPIDHDTPFPGFPPIFYNCRSNVLPIFAAQVEPQKLVPTPAPTIVLPTVTQPTPTVSPGLKPIEVRVAIKAVVVGKKVSSFRGFDIHQAGEGYVIKKDDETIWRGRPNEEPFLSISSAEHWITALLALHELEQQAKENAEKKKAAAVARVAGEGGECC